MNAWQPIETAPKDGTEILLIDKYCFNDAAVCHWDSIDEVWSFMDDSYDGDDDTYDTRIFCDPTHWMPLPEPPKE